MGMGMDMVDEDPGHLAPALVLVAMRYTSEGVAREVG